jgi:hypothetical protein
VPDDRWLPVQGGDDLGRVIGDLLEGLLGEDFRFRPGDFDSFGIVRPVRGEGDVPGLLEHRGPGIPARRQQPEPVDEDHRRGVGRIRAIDLLALAFRDR